MSFKNCTGAILSAARLFPAVFLLNHDRVAWDLAASQHHTSSKLHRSNFATGIAL